VADFLLACGASPAMVENPYEIPQFARLAQALYFNTGLHMSQIQAIDAVIDYRRSADVPQPFFIVDPVAVGATEYRTDQIQYLIEQGRPDLIKGNASEIMTLAGRAGGGKGVDSSPKGAEESVEAARVVADKYDCVVAITGGVDVVADKPSVSQRVGRVSQDVKMLTKITGSGCAVGAVCAAALTSSKGDPFLATVTALAAVKQAAREARHVAEGPGTLGVAILDKLYRLSLSPDSLDCTTVTIDDPAAAAAAEAEAEAAQQESDPVEPADENDKTGGQGEGESPGKSKENGQKA